MYSPINAEKLETSERVNESNIEYLYEWVNESNIEYLYEWVIELITY